jgi:vacuolar-type H+-ATPase subunit H
VIYFYIGISEFLIAKGGDNMYMDAVRDIQALEAQLEQLKAQAQTRAQEALTAAEKDGRALLSDVHQSIRQADAEAMAQCEAQAATQRQTVLEATEADCQALRQQAAGRMDEAVHLILGKVVGR